MFQNVIRKIERSVFFPTCISVNNKVCNFSPLDGDETVLKEGDMLKIHMGCHIDGFSTFVAHTFVLQEGPVTGRAVDIITVVNIAVEVAFKLVRLGKKNKDVTDAIENVVTAYDYKIVEGVFTHQRDTFLVDGNKIGLSVSNLDTRDDVAEFEDNETYVIDIVASTGEGKPKLLDEKQITIYKRDVDENYQLKVKIAKLVLNEISRKFPSVPFTVRALEEKNARLGVAKCMKRELLKPYPVLHVKPDEYVANITFTVLLMSNGSKQITSHPFQELQHTKEIVTS